MRCTIYGAFVFLGSNLRATATPVNKDGNVAPSLQAATLQALEVRADSTAPANSPFIPAPLFDISITDSTGKDASDRITILHQQHSLSSSAKRKRELSRPLNHCPLNQGFHGSNCAPNVNPQAHRIDCMIGNAYTGYLAYCGPNEICVDGLRSPNVFHLAFCVSTENFVIFAKDQLRQATTSAATQAGFHSQAGTKYAVEAVMTSPDSHTTVVASNLDIEAQTSETVNNARSWRTLNGGTAQCNNCGSVEIATVPALTQRIAIRVKVQDSTLSGLLYLTQIVE